ncbi:hypothetical protein [Paraconexibacter sp.]|uniref:hypothetical protein n=1 Tax=Paraconexibacter sp. TaxID=2949640 RepID=UPI0035646FA6
MRSAVTPQSPGSRGALRRRTLPVALVVLALAVVGCGGDDDGDKGATSATQAQRAAALSLQQAMDAAARSIDSVRGTRDSLERMGASLEPQIAQTGDVIVLLTPQAAETDAGRMLLEAAREQRSFLQFASDSATSRSKSAASSLVTRARDAGRRASDAYSRLAQAQTDLAGTLPASTTFNTGRLRDAVTAVFASSKKPSTTTTPKTTTSGSSGGSSPTTGTTSCGDGLSVNSVTSCPFARNVRDAYEASGGSSVIDVYSPVTKLTYTLTCSGGVPVVCRGGDGAVVYIR